MRLNSPTAGNCPNSLSEESESELELEPLLDEELLLELEAVRIELRASAPVHELLILRSLELDEQVQQLLLPFGVSLMR